MEPTKKPLHIIKIGGDILDNKDRLNTFIEEFSLLKEAKILVHGGGKMASELSTKLGLEVEMHEGRRITSKEQLEVVCMVYAGLANKKLISSMQAKSIDALGLSGADLNLIKAEKRAVKKIDYGFAGDIVQVNSDRIKELLALSACPVFCAITHDQKGQLLNTNADTIASSLAVAMSTYFEVSLKFVFTHEGVLKDIHSSNAIFEEINSTDFIQLKKDGVLTQGIIPKLTNAFDALEKKVQEVRIGSSAIINHDKGTKVCL
tara:strand:- start:10072 stop:10854 length:783 start_codon:yes stop_codon:yes gene_type:complete